MKTLINTIRKRRIEKRIAQVKSKIASHNRLAAMGKRYSAPVPAKFNVYHNLKSSTFHMRELKTLYAQRRKLAL